jgi:hypothetical protein
MQLSVIPRISYKKALVIAEFTNTSTMFELCEKMRGQDPITFFCKCAGIGPALSKNVFEFCGSAFEKTRKTIPNDVSQLQ